MAIVTIPNNTQLAQSIACTICGQKVPLAHLTAGLVDTSGEQQFACFGHTWDSSKYILGWVNFTIEQRQATQYGRRVQADGIYVERRPVTGNEVLSWDVAHHFFARQLQGKVIILTDNPSGMLSAVRKQWLRVTRKVQRERSTTLDTALLQELAHTIANMQALVFTNRPPYEEPDANVYLMSSNTTPEWPRGCHTVYATESLDEQQLAIIKGAMPPNGLVVIYR